MEPAVTIEHVFKQYQRGSRSASYLSMRDAIAQAFTKKQATVDDSFFWSLNDVSLTVAKGDRIGIIGRNGAGKSTLLKILCQITPPTKGRVILEGRVASLLEVGTGFHPELNGRENIYLNGSILGLRRAEINRKLDEIIAFSGVDAFIDTPLKRYSSGMQLRLAFSVAAHLEAEILLIDEVLAVGDAEFQRRCIGKMESISKTEGRTILFVSHNLSQVRHICKSAILLEQGSVVAEGAVDTVLNQYDRMLFANPLNEVKRSANDKEYFIEQISLRANSGKLSSPIKKADRFSIEVTVHAANIIANSLIAIRFTNSFGVPVYTTTNADTDLRPTPLQRGRHTFSVNIPVDLFVPGRYSLTIAWNTPNIEELDKSEGELSVEIDDEGYPGAILGDNREGLINKTVAWQKLR